MTLSGRPPGRLWSQAKPCRLVWAFAGVESVGAHLRRVISASKEQNVSGKQMKIRFTQQESQAQKFPGTGPAPSTEQALVCSQVALRNVERVLFRSNPCSAAALLLAQLRLDLVRLEDGVALTRTDILSLLTVAGKVSDCTEVDRG